MPWQNQFWYSFDKGSINARAPSAPGVYGLKSSDGRWLYIGDAPAIASTLRRHLAGDYTALEKNPASFTFERCGHQERVSRRDALIQEFLPLWKPE